MSFAAGGERRDMRGHATFSLDVGTPHWYTRAAESVLKPAENLDFWSLGKNPPGSTSFPSLAGRSVKD
jgi:hypothetical protein